MAYYAIQVYAGRELGICDTIEHVFRSKNIQGLKRVFTTVQKTVSLSEPRKRSVKTGLPSYIFLEAEDQVGGTIYSTIPDHIYHILKAIPGVQNILKDNILEEEMTHFVGGVELFVSLEIAVAEEVINEVDETIQEELMEKKKEVTNDVFAAFKKKRNMNNTYEQKKRRSLLSVAQEFMDKCKKRNIPVAMEHAKKGNKLAFRLLIPAQYFNTCLDKLGKLKLSSIMKNPGGFLQLLHAV